MSKYILLILTLGFALSGFSQNMAERYVLADSALPSRLEKKFRNEWVYPNYIEKTSELWYSVKTVRGTEYFVVNTKNGKKTPAFDHQKLATALSDKLAKTVSPWSLPIRSLMFLPGNRISFRADTSNFYCNLKNYALSYYKPNKKSYEANELPSPDSTLVAVYENFNVSIKNAKSGEMYKATSDGSFELNYGGSISWYFVRNENTNQEIEYELNAEWSPNGRYLWITRHNRTHAQKLYMYKSLPDQGFRSEVYSYYRPLAGDSLIETLDYFIFDTQTKNLVKADMAPVPTFAGYKGEWLKNSSAMVRFSFDRGWQTARFVSINPETGKATALHTETEKTYVDPDLATYHLFDEGKQALFISEKSGWAQIYRLNCDGKSRLVPVTQGEFVCRTVEYVDEKAGKVYFTANGRESGVDPYYTMLYSVGLDGKNLSLLTPEPMFHSVFVNGEKNCFVDNYSTVQNPNTAVLRRLSDGKVLSVLEKADITQLEQTPWVAPEPFVTVGRDGKTPIYGVIFRPKNFDPSAKYPVIDGTYSGPQTIRAPKTFYRGAVNMDQSLAQLGFIVITIDGMGSAFRSKEFHNFSHKNLGDIGGPDHIAAIKQLAEKYPYIDTTRVGIYGHSAGGYDATRALIAYNYFYKVGVSSAGNHDHRIAKAWWPELYMGFPAGKHYDEQSNIMNAAKLKGKILLAHGDMDNNVNPAGSTRMAAELSRANKDFELLLIPGKDHGQLYYDNYFIRKRMDFFVKNLMGAEPPLEYKIK